MNMTVFLFLFLAIGFGSLAFVYCLETRKDDTFSKFYHTKKTENEDAVFVEEDKPSFMENMDILMSAGAAVPKGFKNQKKQQLKKLFDFRKEVPVDAPFDDEDGDDVSAMDPGFHHDDDDSDSLDNRIPVPEMLDDDDVPEGADDDLVLIQEDDE